MQKSFSAFVKEQLDLQCLLCFQQYDSHRKQPYQVCKNHHFFCKQCVSSEKFKRDIRNCPMCRQGISERSIKPLQAYIFIEKIKSFTMHTESNNFHYQQKLKKTQDELKNTQQNLERLTNNQKKLNLQINKLQNQIRKLTKQIKSKQETLVAQRLKNQQKQNCLLNCKKDIKILQKALNVHDMNTITPSNQLHKFNISSSQEKMRLGSDSSRQNQEQDEKRPCKVCNIKHSVLCFGIVCLKCYKKQKI